MLHDCKYDKIKLLHQLSCMAWFIEKHAKENAQKAGDTECANFLDALAKDLKKHQSVLEQMTCK